MTPITATSQFKAVAYLRWCLFRNGLRRKGGAGELAARILVYPIFAAFIIGPVVAATTGAFFAVEHDRPDLLAPVFWAIFALRVLVSINIAPPGLAFDPESLIRFPLTFSRFLIIRTFLGLLSVSTIIGTLALLGAAAGASFANSSLAPIAFATALALALADMFFIRMIFAWIDRWLSTRRARELFTGLIIVGSLGIQYLNFTYNPGLNRGHAQAATQNLASGIHLFQTAEPVLRHLPPGLAASAIAAAAAGRAASALISLAAILLFGLCSAAIFAWRMQREYRGENLSEASPSTSPAPISPARTPQPSPAPLPKVEAPASATARLPPTIAATLHKEWIYLRRNTTQFYGLLAPLAMVFLFTLRIGSRLSSHEWLLPAAVAYSALGLAALAYNAFGLDATGIQLYFLAPVRLGDVLLAKNLFGFALGAAEFVVIFALLAYTSGTPPLATVLGTLGWLCFASLINVTIGNRRSITAPKKMDPSKLARRQAGQLSALISVGLMLILATLGFGLLGLATYLQRPWLPAPIFAVLALAAFFIYRHNLKGLDQLAADNRETLVAELCKTE